ncbi:MAG: glycosyl hydrolase family 28 protein [bacterium]
MILSRIVKSIVFLAVYGYLSVFVFALQVKDGLNESDAKSKFNIIDFGAVADGETLNTIAIQSAIDSAYNSGGGIVIIPHGIFLSGSIHLKNNVELRLEKDAVLLGSTRRTDYEMKDYTAFVIARDAENVTITGEGTIDGQGRELVKDIYRMLDEGLLKDPYYPERSNRPSELNRPELVQFVKCINIFVSGVLMKDAACWVNTYNDCENVLIDRLRINSTAFWNNDGIDLTDCRRVKVTNCDINSADDGICLKSSNKDLYCDSIYIADCKIRSSASALKFGTASAGGFKNIKAERLYVYDTFRSAIALESVDGGVLENVFISDVVAKNTGNAIFLRIGSRNRDNNLYAVSSMKNIIIKNVKVEVPIGKPDKGYETEGPVEKELQNLVPSSIVGLPGQIIENITLENIEIIFDGGGKKEVAFIPLDSLDKVPERPKNYPEFSMFGELPAWGFYVRHADGIKMKNITLKLVEKDFRPAFVFDDSKNISLNGITLTQLTGQKTIVLNDTNVAEIRAIQCDVEIHNPVIIQGNSSAITIK